MIASPFTLRDYQSAAVAAGAAWGKSAPPGGRILYSAPTGTGKSLILLGLRDALPGWAIVTPAVEIVAGLLAKLGETDTSPERGEALGIYTPIRLRNRLAAGTAIMPAGLLIDEAHHAEAATYDLLNALTNSAPAIGVTATPFRGTPKSTAAFRATWGPAVPVLTYPEAAEAGWISVPTCQVCPILDDDVVSVTAGEFVVSELNRDTAAAMPKIADIVAACFDGGSYDRPTMVAMPSVDTVCGLTAELRRRALPAVAVTAETADRAAAFRDAVERRSVLVQINVVSEGVDLPLRRLIDAQPTLSPVRWQQLFGRITRPVAAGELPPEYVCCNRNLLRHAYLLAGLIPAATIVNAETAFPPSVRSGLRVVGFEGLGRFKADRVPLADGTSGVMYAISAVEGDTVRQYVVIASPRFPDVLTATRENLRNDDGTAYGRWRRCDEMPPIETGFASVGRGAVTDKMAAWWARDARRFGLNPDVTPTRRTFNALPVLADLRVSL
jgi:hypothetical protein